MALGYYLVHNENRINGSWPLLRIWLVMAENERQAAKVASSKFDKVARTFRLDRPALTSLWIDDVPRRLIPDSPHKDWCRPLEFKIIEPGEGPHYRILFFLTRDRGLAWGGRVLVSGDDLKLRYPLLPNEVKGAEFVEAVRNFDWHYGQKQKQASPWHKVPKSKVLPRST